MSLYTLQNIRKYRYLFHPDIAQKIRPYLLVLAYSFNHFLQKPKAVGFVTKPLSIRNFRLPSFLLYGFRLFHIYSTKKLKTHGEFRKE